MRQPGFRSFFVVALVVHGVLLWCSRSLDIPSPSPSPASAPRMVSLDPSELAFVELSDAPVLRGSDVGASASNDVRPSASNDVRPPASDDVRPPASNTVPEERPSEDPAAGLLRANASETPGNGDFAVPPSNAVGAPPPSEAPAPAPDAAEARSSGPRLTLEQMGVGKPSAFALPELDAVNEVALAEDRLQRSFAQAQLDGDEARGLGSHVLVTSVVNQVATGSAPPRSKARLDVRVNADGSVSEVNVVEANSGFEIWQRVAQLARAGLSGKRLRHGLGRPVRLLIEVESKVQLPSGRSPGANVSVFGIPVNESGYEDSTTVKVLSPEVKLEKVPVLDPTQTGGTSLEVPVPVVRFTILGVNGDPVDIGAPARQVVHSRLVKQDVL